MKYSEEQIRELARDARLALTDAEVARYTKDLQLLAELAEVLCEIPTPSREADEGAMSAKTALREDVVYPCLSREELLRVSPRSRDGYLVVPRTVEE